MYRSMPSLVLHSSTAAIPALTIGIQGARLAFAQKAFSPGKLNCMKQNSLKRLSAEKVYKALSCMGNFFGKSDAFIETNKAAKPRCIIITFF